MLERRYTFNAPLASVSNFFDCLRQGEAHGVLSTVGGTQESVFPLSPDEPLPPEDAETTRRRIIWCWREALADFRGFLLELWMHQPTGETWQAWAASIDLTTEQQGSCTATLRVAESLFWLGNQQPVPKPVVFLLQRWALATWREMVTTWKNGRRGGQGEGGPPVRPEEPKEGAGLDAWFDWYHAMHQAGFRCTLKEIAEKSGYTLGWVKQQHRRRKLSGG